MVLFSQPLPLCLMAQGCFNKTNRVFSTMALDQIHEQNIWTIKSSTESSFANRVNDSAFFGGRHTVWKFDKLLMSLKIHLDLKLKIVIAIMKIPQALLVNSTDT